MLCEGGISKCYIIAFPGRQLTPAAEIIRKIFLLSIGLGRVSISCGQPKDDVIRGQRSFVIK